jgi:Methyltransferase domain
MRSRYNTEIKPKAKNSTMNKKDICLHIGCWQDVGAGWENFDASIYVKISKIPLIGNQILATVKAPQFSPQIQYGDVIKGLNIPPNSCKLIFASHILEHLTLADFDLALTNIYNYLQPEGTLRIIVPDLESYIHKYAAQKNNQNTAATAAYVFMTESFLGEQDSRKTFLQRFKSIFSNSRHQWMWDEQSLTSALTKHGFKNIKKCGYGQWADPRFELVERKDRHDDAICLEATK